MIDSEAPRTSTGEARTVNDLRDRIAAAIREADGHWCMYGEGIDADHLADAVMEVLASEPPTATDEDEGPPVQCWHIEPGTPCDWDICRQPERLAAGDYGTDPATDPLPTPNLDRLRGGRLPR